MNGWILVVVHEHPREMGTCQHSNYISPTFSAFHTIKLMSRRYTNQSINQTVSQSANSQPVSKLVNQSFNQLIKQYTNQTANTPTYLTIVVCWVVVVGAFGAEGRELDSTSSCHVGTLGKSFTLNFLYYLILR